MRHAYVIPTYQQSPHLEECLESVCGQADSDIVVVTSTPFDGIDRLIARYGARLVVHGPNNGIGHDWNMAFAAAETPLVTIAHQDDIYRPGHAAEMRSAFEEFPSALLAFTDYRELENDGVRPSNRTLLVKSVQRELAFLGRPSVRSVVGKRMLLRFGNPVPCPAVTFNKALIPAFRFRTDMRTNMDWAAWVYLAGERGDFLYIRKPLVHHRIHPGSETSACISDGARAKEDEEMFRSFWPPLVARLLARFYAASYSTNG